MTMTTLARMHAMLPASQLINISAEAAQHHVIQAVETDSRKVENHSLFIALKGERFDAHQFLPEVEAAGASAVMISDQNACPNTLPAICVADTRIGLGDFAKAWRAQFALPLALVTGSNGKTTVKEMIASLFKAAVGEDASLVTRGNLNNDIGLPITLLRLRDHHRLAVIELGMNHPGETAVLAGIAQPTIALINNAQREHQEFMATVEAVAKEHADAIAALPINGVAVIPADSPFTADWKAIAGQRQVIDFALDADAAVKGSILHNGHIKIETDQGAIEVRLATLGDHNVRNALAATAVGLAAKLDLRTIRLGLESFTPVVGRMQSKRVGQCLLINDSYNANPDSVRAAIDALEKTGTKTCLVLGDMGEVGSKGPEFHREVGAYAAEHGISYLLALGELSRFAIQGFNETSLRLGTLAEATHFETVEALNAKLAIVCQILKQALDRDAVFTVLIKGSRFMRMERVVEAAESLLLEDQPCS